MIRAQSNQSINALDGECVLATTREDLYQIRICSQVYTPPLRPAKFLLCHSHDFVNCADIQRGCFNAVWAGIDPGQQQYLGFRLQSLVNTQTIEDKEAKESVKAELLSRMDYFLRYNESTEHASNVNNFLMVLRSLSDNGMKEMLVMTQPRPPEFVLPEETFTASTDRSTIGSTDTTVGLTAPSITSTLTPEGGSAPTLTPTSPDAGNPGNTTSKGCCDIL